MSPTPTYRGGSEPKNYLSYLPNLREWGAKGDGVTDDTSAINRAVKELVKEGNAGPNNGSIFVPTGVYFHEGEITAFKEQTGIRLIGVGGIAGGGGIGVGSSLASSIFIYGGSGTRGWDFRSAVGIGLENIHCLAWGNGFVGPIWDMGGTEAKPGALAHFINSRAEGTRVGGKSTEEIVACKGALLDFSNAHTFDNCTFSSCKEGVEGINNVTHSSVAHRFNSCFFSGNQSFHVANPQEAWDFNTCIAESLFNRKGELLNKAGFIGYNKVFQSHGVNLFNCWSGSNVPAARAGANVEARGEGWNIIGGSYNTGEIGIFFPEGPIGSTVTGVRFWKVNSGITITGKTIRSKIAFNNAVEAIAMLTDTVKEYTKSLVENEAGELKVFA